MDTFHLVNVRKKSVAFFVIILLTININKGFSQTDAQMPEIKYRVTWSKTISDLDIKNAMSISTGPDGSVYIADTGNNRIVKLNSSGLCIRKHGGFGWGAGQFDSPVSICGRNGLDVFVADYFNNRIERFDKDLNYISVLSPNDQWDENFYFGFPLGVDISSQGELFCVDGENRRILKFDVMGNPQIEFGGFSAGEGRLESPCCVLVSDKGRVYISDKDLGYIRVFDVHGNFLFDIGNGILKNPAGIAELNFREIAVADKTLNRVFIFTSDGKLLKEFTLSDFTALKFNKLSDVAFWNDLLFVLDSGRSSIDVFTCTW
ncbi:NHL repeat-containing protein [bacterium]|nr:NHL repeat-containing protein [bacterium]